MNKALLGAAGAALLGTAGVAAVIVGSSGGEEEVAQQQATASAPFATSSPTPGVSSTPGATPAATFSTLPACPTPGPGRTFQYQPITSGETKEYTDKDAGYSLAYPADWTICKDDQDPQTPDLVGTISLYDVGGAHRLPFEPIPKPSP